LFPDPSPFAVEAGATAQQQEREARAPGEMVTPSIHVRPEAAIRLKNPGVGCGVRRLVAAFTAGTTCRPSSTASSGVSRRQDARVTAETLSPCAEPRMLSGLCLSDMSLRQRKRRQVSALQRVTTTSGCTPSRARERSD
jgi:hypothetical protein